MNRQTGHGLSRVGCRGLPCDLSAIARRATAEAFERSRVSGFRFQETGGKWRRALSPLSTLRSSILPYFQSSILSLLLAAGPLLAETLNTCLSWGRFCSTIRPWTLAWTRLWMLLPASCLRRVLMP